MNISLVACLLTFQLWSNSEAFLPLKNHHRRTNWAVDGSLKQKTEISKPEIESPSCSLTKNTRYLSSTLKKSEKWWGSILLTNRCRPRGLASESVWKPERIISSGKQSQKVCSPSCRNLSRREPPDFDLRRPLEKVDNTFQWNGGMLQGKRSEANTTQSGNLII